MPAYVAFAGAFNTTAGSHNATVTTPAIGDTIIVLGGYTGGTAASGSYTDNQAGGTYTKLASSVKNASADTWELFVRDNLITTTTSHIVTQADPPAQIRAAGSGRSAAPASSSVGQLRSSSSRCCRTRRCPVCRR